MIFEIEDRQIGRKRGGKLQQKKMSNKYETELICGDTQLASD